MNKDRRSIVIIAICVFIVLFIGASIFGIFYINQHKNADNDVNQEHINDYEEENDNGYSNNDDYIIDDEIGEEYEPEENSDVISYGGFEFTKEEGYYYQISNDNLLMQNDALFVTLIVDKGNYDGLVTEEIKTNLRNNFEAIGYNVGAMQTGTYAGTRKAFTIELTAPNGELGFYYLTPLNQDFFAEGFVVFGVKETFDYVYVNQGMMLIGEPRYVGDNQEFTPTSDFKLGKFEDILKN